MKDGQIGQKAVAQLARVVAEASAKPSGATP